MEENLNTFLEANEREKLWEPNLTITRITKKMIHWLLAHPTIYEIFQTQDWNTRVAAIRKLMSTSNITLGTQKAIMLIFLKSGHTIIKTINEMVKSAVKNLNEEDAIEMVDFLLDRARWLPNLIRLTSDCSSLRYSKLFCKYFKQTIKFCVQHSAGGVIRCFLRRGFQLIGLENDVEGDLYYPYCLDKMKGLENMSVGIELFKTIPDWEHMPFVILSTYLYDDFFTIDDPDDIFERLYKGLHFDLNKIMGLADYSVLFNNTLFSAPRNVTQKQLAKFAKHIDYLKTNGYISFDGFETYDEDFHPIKTLLDDAGMGDVVSLPRLLLLRFYLSQMDCPEQAVKWFREFTPNELRTVLDYGATVVGRDSAPFPLRHDWYYDTRYATYYGEPPTLKQTKQIALCLANNTCSRQMMQDVAETCVALREHLAGPFTLQLMAKVAIRDQLRRSGNWSRKHVSKVVNLLPVPKPFKKIIGSSVTPLW